MSKEMISSRLSLLSDREDTTGRKIPKKINCEMQLKHKRVNMRAKSFGLKLIVSSDALWSWECLGLKTSKHVEQSKRIVTVKRVSTWRETRRECTKFCNFVRTRIRTEYSATSLIMMQRK